MYSTRKVMVFVILLSQMGLYSNSYCQIVDTISAKDIYVLSSNQSLNQNNNIKSNNINFCSQNKTTGMNQENILLGIINREYITNGSSFSFNEISLHSSDCKYMAVYNKSTMNYDFYPSNFAINFNLNSPRIGTQHFSRIKIDSFNPYGAIKPADMVFLGIANSLLKTFQK